MFAQWWTTIGAMSIPVGAVLMIAKPETAGISQWIIVAGFVFAIAGLALTFREERRKQEKEMARAVWEVSSLLVLHHIALALGVDMNELLKQEKVLQEKDGHTSEGNTTL